MDIKRMVSDILWLANKSGSEDIFAAELEGYLKSALKGTVKYEDGKIVTCPKCEGSKIEYHKTTNELISCRTCIGVGRVRLMHWWISEETK